MSGTNPKFFQKRSDVRVNQARVSVERLMKAGRTARAAVVIVSTEMGLSDEKTIELQRYADNKSKTGTRYV